MKIPPCKAVEPWPLVAVTLWLIFWQWALPVLRLSSKLEILGQLLLQEFAHGTQHGGTKLSLTASATTQASVYGSRMVSKKPTLLGERVFTGVESFMGFWSESVHASAHFRAPLPDFFV